MKGNIGNEQTLAIDYTPKLSIEFGYEWEVYYFNNEYEWNYGFDIHIEWYKINKWYNVFNKRFCVTHQIESLTMEPSVATYFIKNVVSWNTYLFKNFKITSLE